MSIALNKLMCKDCDTDQLGPDFVCAGMSLLIQDSTPEDLTP